MPYLLKRNGNYYYNRRTPEQYRDYDPRPYVRVSLKTDSRQLAWRKAILYNDQVEAYWQSLVAANLSHDHSRFGKAVNIARRLGFCYQPLSTVAALPIEDLVERILATKDATPSQVEAVLGGKKQSEMLLSKITEAYWKLTKDKTINKSVAQVRKWRNPRTKAVLNFIAIVGDKPVSKITRNDTVAFRDWWIDRIKEKNMNAGTANKDLIHLKGVLEAVSEHYQCGLNISHLFKKLMMETRFKQTRLPFTSPQIVALLSSPRLLKMNSEARWFLHAAAETGARPSEIVGLLPEDIILNDPIPHIWIRDRKGRPLKTKHSERQIPLVGYALDAFKAMPNGFPKYRDRTDNLTAAVNKFLRGNKLLPSEQHSIYSLRHSFQDRILSVNAPDRIQAELMGHKFNRPKYGDGGSLQQKLDYMQMIQLK